MPTLTSISTSATPAVAAASIVSSLSTATVTRASRRARARRRSAPTDRDWHTDELPATPQRDFLIPSARWSEAPPSLHELGADLGIPLVAYKRRIGRFLLWRAGPAVGADARYAAIDASDLGRSYTF